MKDYKFITEGNIGKTLMKLSWPVAIAMIVQLSYGLMDTFFVAKLGANEVAAVTYSFPIMFIFFSLAQGLAVGTTSLIAQYSGKKDVKNASNIAEHSLVLSIVIAILLSLTVEIFQKQIFRLIGAPESLIPLITQYSTIMFGAVAIIFIAFIGNSILRGIGEMKVPMKVMLFSSLLNLILDPLFIFGVWFFPKMGIAGAATATVISRTIMVVMILYMVFKEKKYLQLSLKNFSFQPKILKQIFKVGFPASASSSLNAIGGTIIISVISVFGPMAIAAWGIIMRIESVIFLPLRGMGTSSITMVGQNLGAGKQKRAVNSAKLALLISIISVSVLGFLLYRYSGFLISLFVLQKEVLLFGTLYFSVIVFSYPFQGLLYTGEAILQGAGRMKNVLIADSIRWAIILGVGFVFKNALDIHSFLLVILGAIIISSLYIGITLLFGKWKSPVIINEAELNEKIMEMD